MEQRRLILFILLSVLIWFGWMIIGPKVVPNWFPAKPQAQQNQPVAGQPEAGPGGDAVAAAPAPDQPGPAKPAAAQPAPAAQAWPQFPKDQKVVLGSQDPASGYFLELTLTSRGAAIESAVLNDPRYVAQNDRSRQLKVVGNDPDEEQQTLAAAVHVDRQQAPDDKSLAVVDWEIVHKNESSVTFRFPWPDGSAEILKTYTLHKGQPAQRDDDYNGYVVDLDIKFISHANRPLPVQYDLRGPVGLPLENADNARTFVEIKVGTVAKPGSPVVMPAKDVVKQLDAVAAGDRAQVDQWRDPLQYIGVDVQYFAALILPKDQAQDDDGDGKPGYFEESEPVLIDKQAKPERSDLSVTLKSRELVVPPNGSRQHSFSVYLGPKRSTLLKPLQADGIISFGMFGRISVWMVWLLNAFHYVLYLPYALAIVLLTLIVRACMFPITRKQAAGAKKMKDLQPKLQELKTKYAKEPEKFWQAQRDLFRKHNYHPLAGCLPLVLQLPIFIGLYNALANAVDLRMEQFLWINDLTAPDALFGLPFTLPFIGSSQFNLLPLITIALWIVQQKMFMPPAVSEEQEMQYKIMNYMMIFIGFMIYKVPSGLCVYFITSTLWGISERKLVERLKPDEKKTAETAVETKPDAAAPPDEPRRPGFFARLLAAADEARNQTNGKSGFGPAGDRDDEDRRGGKKKRSRQR
jgi:YidC/Oxa1 family membrane protein insertase